MRLDAKAWLDHLDAARTLALAGDAEGVHQVRVCTRRLRVWLGFKGHAALQEELRWLGHALALARDLDVFGEVLTAAARKQLRVSALKMIVDALASERWSMLRQRLEHVRAPKKSKAKRALRKLEQKLKKRRAALPSNDGAALHRLRRALRHVRYAREWLGVDTAELATEQDRLGAVCDLLALEGFAQTHHAEVPVQLSEGIARCFELLEEER